MALAIHVLLLCVVVAHAEVLGDNQKAKLHDTDVAVAVEISAHGAVQFTRRAGTEAEAAFSERASKSAAELQAGTSQSLSLTEAEEHIMRVIAARSQLIGTRSRWSWLKTIWEEAKEIAQKVIVVVATVIIDVAEQLVALWRTYTSWCEVCKAALIEEQGGDETVAGEASLKKSAHHEVQSHTKTASGCLNPDNPDPTFCHKCFNEAKEDCDKNSKDIGDHEERQIAVAACVMDLACNEPNVCKDWKCAKCAGVSGCGGLLESNESQEIADIHARAGGLDRETDGQETFNMDQSMDGKCG